MNDSEINFDDVHRQPAKSDIVETYSISEVIDEPAIPGETELF